MIRLILLFGMASAAQVDSLNRLQKEKLSAIRVAAHQAIRESLLSEKQKASSERKKSTLQKLPKESKRTVRK